MNNKMTNDAPSVTTAIAAASPSPNSVCSSFLTINMGITFSSVMKITEPYSPSALANANAKPVNNAGKIVGRITCHRVCHRVAPKLAAASSTSMSMSSSAGCKVRTTNGKPMKQSATMTPIREYVISIP